ncbi:hypothetical protein VSDG_03416 [Cytospora chrysosperma]|uniref:SET domain-containing protein n=1 Tax=Cytospora chrysosperma TaxID=252740 RepID=A0A423WBC8_CYTCH|nr:hypothetical protein VSDG_03416 [Valsa sordida]
MASTWISLLLFVQVGALIHEQVAFDNSDVCWWSLAPPDPTCPILNKQNLTEIVQNLVRPYQWDLRGKCVGNYCLFSNRGFAGGRGIAVITTQDNFERVKRVGNLLERYSVSFDHDEANLPFHIGDINGKGVGILARQPLSRGDPIMAHTPVLLVHDAFRHDLDQHAQHDLLELAVESLPAQTTALLMDQASYGPEEHRIENILTTDAFPVDVGGEDGHHYGVFPEAAKQSHDCRPNTAFHIDPATLMLVTTAVRAITPGEELTLSRLALTDLLADKEDRAQLVGGSSGCRCSQCALPVEEATESDNRLSEIRWIHGQLSRYDTEDVSVGLITYLLKLYEDERLQCCMVVAYALAAVNFNSLGLDKQAVTYAHLARDAQSIAAVEDAPHRHPWDIIDEMLQDPRRHSSFARRVKEG